MAESSAGTQLKAARERLGIEAREISDALNLSQSAIHALEADDFAEFTAPVFVRGYLRSYAKLVELDPDVVVAALPGAGPAEASAPPSVETRLSGAQPVTPSGGFPEARRRIQRLFTELYREQPVATVVGAGAAVALLLVLLWLLLSGAETPASTAPAAALATEQKPPPVGDTAAALASAPTDTVAPASPFAAIADQRSAAEPASEDDGQASPSAAVAATMAEASTPTALGPEDTSTYTRIGSGDDRLVLSFTADCWVEIRNSAGRQVFGDVGVADSTLRLLGSGPFRIVLGYAPGASLTFNGSVVALAPHTQNNVARLVVGQ